MNASRKAGLALGGALLLYYALLSYLARGLTLDYWDSLLTLMNAVALGGEGSWSLDVTRPPLLSLLLSPGLAARWRAGGAGGVLEFARVVMPLVPASLAGLSLWAYRRHFPAPLAAALAALLALNPTVVRYAPFALSDAFSALVALLFWWAAWRYLEKPGPARWWAAVGALALCVAARYHLFVLAAGPVAFAALDARRRRMVPALAALAPAAWGLVLLWSGLHLFAAGAGGSPLALAAEAAGRIHAYVFVNLEYAISDAPLHGYSPATLYAAALWRQLGPLGLAAMAWGLVLARRGTALERFAGLCLGTGLLLLHVPAAKEGRYLLTFAPLLYAAIGRGLSAAWEGRRWRWSAAAAVLAFAVLEPWSGLRRSVLFLRGDYAMRSSVPYQLADRFHGTKSPGWVGGDLSLWRHDGLTEEELPILAAPVMPFFRAGPFAEPASLEAAADAPLVVEVLQERAPGSPLGRVWARGSRGLVHESDIVAAAVIPAKR